MENVIVIGGGLMGCSAAWQLARRGQKVLLIEQQKRKYKNGSSYGNSRISRSLGPRYSVFSYVQNVTVKEVQGLLDFLNKKEGAAKHNMQDIYTTSPVSYFFPEEKSYELGRMLYKYQRDKYKEGSGDEAFLKFGVTIPENQTLVREYKEHSGSMNPKTLINKLRKGIQLKKGKIRFGQKVTKLVRYNGYYEVQVTDTQTGKKKVYQAKKVIVSAGAHTPKILKHVAPYFKRLIIPKKVVLSYFKISKKRYKQLTKQEKQHIRDAHPVFDQNEGQFFSMIDTVDKDGVPVFKVGGHTRRRNILDIDGIWEKDIRKKDIKWSRKQFRKYLEKLEIDVKKKEIEYVDGYNCVYSMSRDGVPYVTTVFDERNIMDPNLIVIGGMSGVGAKGCLAYGKMAMDIWFGSKDKSRAYRVAKDALGNASRRLRVVKPKRHRKYNWLRDY